MCASETHGADHQSVVRVKVGERWSGELSSSSEALVHLSIVHFPSCFTMMSNSVYGPVPLKGPLPLAGSSQTVPVIPSPLISELV